VRHQARRELAYAEDDAVDVGPQSTRVLLVCQRSDRALARNDPGVEERRVVLALECTPRGGVADVELRQIECRDLGVAERLRKCAAEAAAAARDQHPHGMSTTLPTLLRDSTSSCARSTSSSGSYAPTRGRSAPV